MIMKTTRSRDGRRRITLNVPVRLDAELMATFVTKRQWPDEDEIGPAEFAASAIAMGIRKLRAICVSVVQSHGTEGPWYDVQERGLCEHRDALAAALRGKFNID